jgi:multiple sugar transport system ATP-binding protein
MAWVRFEQVSKVYPDGYRAVNGIDLEIGDGEFMVLVGPSGCGKTTALRMVAGLEEITEGVLRIGDRVVNHVPSKDRDIAMVFQSYALYPHLSVYENIAFGLRLKKVPKAEIERRVQNAARILGLEELLKRKPRALSGGQRQRVAMGRALVREPKAFLLDEPLSNLDAKLRVEMRAELKRLHRRIGITTIHVTHDQVEAMTLGDRIAVLSDGRLQQTGVPEEVYERPTNVFVAGFIGSPPMNLLRGSATGGTVRAGSLELSRPGTPDGDVTVGVRPEALVPAVDGQPWLELEADVIEPLGDEVVVHGGVEASAARSGAEDEDARLLAHEDPRAPVTVRLDPALRPKPGERIRLSVDPARVHLFNPNTGAALG